MREVEQQLLRIGKQGHGRRHRFHTSNITRFRYITTIFRSSTTFRYITLLDKKHLNSSGETPYVVSPILAHRLLITEVSWELLLLANRFATVYQETVR